MTGQFGTQTEVMRTAGAHVFEVRDQIQQQLASLRSQLAPLEGTWRGSASVAFTALMERWNTDAAAIGQSLQAIGESIQASGAQYRATEDDVAASTSRIGQALSGPSS